MRWRCGWRWLRFHDGNGARLSVACFLFVIFLSSISWTTSSRFSFAFFLRKRRYTVSSTASSKLARRPHCNSTTTNAPILLQLRQQKRIHTTPGPLYICSFCYHNTCRCCHKTLYYGKAGVADLGDDFWEGGRDYFVKVG